MELELWIQSIAARRWPILQHTARLLKDACARGSDIINFTDLANLCLLDPLLLFDLLRVMGRSRALQRNESMPTVEQVLILMGLQLINNRFGTIMHLGEQQGALSPEVMETLGAWLGQARAAAFLIKDWWSQAGEYKVEEGFILAQMYNLPACLYIMQHNTVPASEGAAALERVFQCDYNMLLRQFIQMMPLPVALANLLSEGESSKRLSLFQYAMTTINTLPLGTFTPGWCEGVEAAGSLIGVGWEPAYRAVVHAVLAAARQPRIIGYAYPVRWMLMIQEDQPADVKGGVPVELASAQLESVEAEEAQMQQTVMDYLAANQFERVLYYCYNTYEQVLELKSQVGWAEGNELIKIKLNVAPGSFLAQFTTKVQGFHGSATVRDQLKNRYKDVFFDYIGDHEFALTSLFNQGVLCGMVYVDNGISKRPIDKAAYQDFKNWAAQLQ